MTSPRRVTPTAVQVLPADAPEVDWLAARQRYLCSSDIPAVMGVDRYRTNLHVWLDKRGELPEREVGEEALWGKALEPVVAAQWCRRNRSVIRRVGLVVCTAPWGPTGTDGWAGCTLDRRIVECPLGKNQGPCALEVKCRTAFLQSRWLRGVPDDVLAQVLWQIAVTGYSHLHVACLIGGNDYRQFVVRRTEHEDLLAQIRTQGAIFWQVNILDGHRPAPEGLAVGQPLTDLYNDLHPVRDGVVELGTRDHLVTVTDALSTRDEGRVLKARGKRMQDESKATLIGLLGGAEIAMVDGHLAYTYEAHERQGVDMDRLQAEFPEAWAACCTLTEVRTLRITSDWWMSNEEGN